MPLARVLSMLVFSALLPWSLSFGQEEPGVADAARAAPGERLIVEAPLGTPDDAQATASRDPQPAPEDRESAPPADNDDAIPQGPSIPGMALSTARAEGIALQAFVDGIALGLQREHGLAAVSLSVVRNDALLLAKAYGLADVAAGRAATADTTLFRIGSVSKTFTWTAVMMLVERGQIDLDADVNRYLKAVRIREAFGTPVTMRHLMHHRAGFEDSLRLFAVSDDDPRSLEELLIAQQPARVYAPGLRTSYSNWGSALAAQLVADVSGQSYDAFLRREILDPLGMHSSTFVAPSKLEDSVRANLATGYKRDKGALGLQGYMQIGAYWPAGGVASTATDMARWMRFHLGGGALEGVRLMSAETHARMWTRAYDDRIGAPDLAHGFQDRSYRGLRALGHGGATAAFFTNMVLVPELNLGIYVSQSSQQSRLPVGLLPDLIIDHFHGGQFQPALTMDASSTEALTDFAGTYLNNRRVFSSFSAVLGLGSTGRVVPVSNDALIATLNGEDRQFRRVGNERDLFESADGARIAFVREGDRVVALADSSGVHTLEKVGLLNSPHTAFAALAVVVLSALTTLLGFWWRLGRGADVGQGPASSIAASVALLSALSVVAFCVSVVLLLLDFQKFDLATMASFYPPRSMLYTQYAAWAILGAAVAMWLALVLAYKAIGWGLWRRLHFAFFALTLAFAAFQLWQWRVYGAPLY